MIEPLKLIPVPESLRGRLLLAATVTLIAFLGLAGIALDRAFISSATTAENNLLRAQIFALLAVIDVDQEGRIFAPGRLPDARLSNPDSGLYAAILNDKNNMIWRSPSSLGLNFQGLSKQPPGTEYFAQAGNSTGSPFYIEFGVSWEVDPGESHTFTLVMAHGNDDFVEMIHAYRQDLFFWLGTAGIILLLVQSLILRWGLQPLRQVTEELDKIEHAKQDHIEGEYPFEIAQLSRRINLFIENERNSLNRYRHTLSDLAHSIKTPLAVLRGLIEAERKPDSAEISEQVDRIGSIVDYQLARAASSSYQAFHTAVKLDAIVNKTIDSLLKVYADKKIRFVVDVDADARFYGDEGDLYELLGNCLDNACKWSRSVIEVSAEQLQEPSMIHAGLRILVDDDGPGIPVATRRQVLERGARADEQIHGQGIGLAVVREIIARYGGILEIGTSQLGGASLQLNFPCR